MTLFKHVERKQDALPKNNFLEKVEETENLATQCWSATAYHVVRYNLYTHLYLSLLLKTDEINSKNHLSQQPISS